MRTSYYSLRHKALGASASLLLALSLAGCRDRVFDYGINENGSSTEHSSAADDQDLKPVSVSFVMPASSEPARATPGSVLRANTEAKELTLDSENAIEMASLKVYAFRKNTTSGNFEYQYNPPLTKLTPDAGTNGRKGKMVLLARDSQSFPTVFLFVQAGKVKGDEILAPKASEELEHFKARLSVERPDDLLWNKEGEVLPMVAETRPVVVKHDRPMPELTTDPVRFLRAVARIDVGIKVQTTGANRFDEPEPGVKDKALLEVHLFNTRNQVRLFPETDKLKWSQTEHKVVAPSTPMHGDPLTAFAKPNREEDVYTNPKADKIAFLKRSIYTLETPNDPDALLEMGKDGKLKPQRPDVHMARPYLVVKIADVKGGAVDQNSATYYRIDFLQRNGDEATATYKYIHLLRNYRYMVNITSIKGPGFKEIEDAKQGPAANIMYNVTVWDESMLSDVKYDGQYMLGVSQDHFTFYRDGGEISAKVQTSWPQGFKIKGLPSWITSTIKPSDPTKTGDTDEKIVTFKISEKTMKNRTWPEKKEDVVNALKAAYVEAGRMKWFLHFTQSKEINLEIALFSDEACTQPLQFVQINQYGESYNANNPAKSVKGIDGSTTLTKEQAGAIVTFYAKTDPQDIQPVLSSTTGNHFKVNMVQKLANGVWKYTVTAPDITTNSEYFDIFNNTLTFTISHTETGKTASADLSLMQIEYSAIPYSDKMLYRSLFDIENTMHDIVMMDGKSHEYYIKANTEYRIKLISAKSIYDSNKDVIEPFDDVHEKSPSLSGHAVTFKTKDDLSDPSLFEGLAVFEISSPRGFFPTQKFQFRLVSGIVQPEANSYMILRNAAQGILIPVSRVNTAADYYKMLLNHDSKLQGKKGLPGPVADFELDRLDDDDDWYLNIVWTDIHNEDGTNKTEVAGLKDLSRMGGTGPNSYIYVRPGNEAGNILIELKSGKIAGNPTLWSWHIWIVDEYPKEIHVHKYKSAENDAAPELFLMDHLLGAKSAPLYDLMKSTKNARIDYDALGFQYQWGRKDPFPSMGHMYRFPFYDGEGRKFNFKAYQKGDRSNYGTQNAEDAYGSVLTMKQSIRSPYTLVSQQTFWLFESFPSGSSSYYNDKYVFLYPWNKPTIDENPDEYGGKTVFDPSPYGWRLMTHAEALSLRWAYYYYPEVKSPLPGTIYDGSYTNNFTANPLGTGLSGDEVIYASAQARKGTPAGRYLLNSLGNSLGWSPSSAINATYNRCITYSVRPVKESSTVIRDDYTRYLPQKVFKD